ncbi:MAG: hypothetical protein ABH868_07730 [bacterium]
MKLNMKRRSFVYLFFLLITVFCVKNVFAGAGLSTSWGEVVIRNIHVGQTYSVQESSNLLFKLTNTGDQDANIRIEVISPTSDNLKESYESIPDVAWVSLDKYRFLAKPGETVETDVKISIPDDPEYLNKKYQVYLFAYTIESPGFMGVGLRSRLLLHTAALRPTRTVKIVAPPKGNLDFKVHPYEVHLEDIKISKKYDVGKVADKAFEIVNFSDSEESYIIKSLDPNQILTSLPGGFEPAPDAGFISFKEDQLSIKSKGSENPKIYLRIPKEDKYKGKKYVFVIYTEKMNQGKPMGVYNRIYVTTKQ